MASFAVPSDELTHSLPEQEDGSAWPFTLTSGGVTLFADHCRDIIAALIPGYADLPDTQEGRDEALIARHSLCVQVASFTQAALLADAASEGAFDPTVESEDVLTVLFQDKLVPVEDVDEWDHKVVPLVLIATDYDPFVESRPLVGGNVLWLDPSNELDLLTSLSALGSIDFAVHADQ